MTGLLGTFLLLLSVSSSGLAWTFFETGGSLDDPTPAYPYPRIVLMGPSGAGKSTLANVLSGCLPNDNSCFETCAGVDSCTQETSINVVTYLGDDAYGSSTLTDTPGFGDSGIEGDGPIITNIIEALKHNLGDANVILLCIDYSQRFGPDLQNMVTELESLFGRSQVWDHVAIEVTKWAFTDAAILNRNRTGVTEESALHDINQKIMEISHLNKSLPGVFIDSFAAFPEEQEDETQQFYFKKYTQELWDLALATPTLQFLSIEDILAELSECRSANDCLTEVLEGRLTQVESDVMKNTAQISTVVGVCAYAYGKTGTGTITYASTSGTSTDGSYISTGTGKYIVRTSGLYSITFSAYTYGQADIYLYKDGARQDDTKYRSSQDGDANQWDQGSKSVVMCLTKNQEIHLYADSNTGDIWRLHFCITLLSATNTC